MFGIVVMVVGFVAVILAMLGLTPRLEEWATTAPAATGSERDDELVEGAGWS
jgi:hypothetical protein